MGRKAQMADAALTALFRKIFEDAPTRIFVHRQRRFADIVQQIKIEIVHLALLQLFGENAGRIVRRADLMTRELISQIETRARISA